ncbi:hypothetical protein L228DRAFT_269516 [Xylona heveae TC161]|uniref:PAN2-PAN3 deadenylation complex catalytic subunit PAN2 n=1 Tax=Xylona heveae (strain CBS 132557 / TC161) TaxID=1328760 RepID=A0A165FLG1_XYLHT|nr:hypothetical protein L228DRAFT_269516 [Xylona heveae TC161]KZF21116.1 hypothetical protein L228DRAFT_269516 [Xylona heveae TC161]
METDWDEIARVGFPPPGIHAMPTPASTLAFDNSQELLWAGNEYGRVSSFYGPELQKYTSFRAHASVEGPVRQLLFNDKGVISVASRSIHMSSRRGLTMWHITHDKMIDLRCMSYTSKGTSEILVAGCQPTMFRVDVDKGKIVEELPAADQYTMMKRAHYICAATKTGAVDMLDHYSFKVVKKWQAHAGYINDMDARNNFLVTCGVSPRQQQAYMLDPLANVFDLKKLAPLPPIPFHAGAAFVRMHPRMSTTSIVASQTGQLQVVDLMNPNTVNLRQANISSFLMALEMAPSGEALALTDGDCFLHLWGSRSKIHFAELSSPTELADPVVPLQPLDWSIDTPLHSIGLPYYRDTLLSSWPSHLVFEVGNPPSKLDPDILATMTASGYAPNPKKTRRYQVHDTRLAEKISAPLMAPKFLSEKARESPSSPRTERRISDAAEALGEIALAGGAPIKAEVPVMYRNVEIKYSRFGVDDFDFEYYNKTKYSGLETHIANSYTNPLLQLLKFTPLLRNIALHHAASSCLVESCLLCELGYLFDMLDKANGQNCQATNFLKTFSSLHQAAALGLLEESSPNSSLTAMIQSVCRFLLDRITTDFTSTSNSTQIEEILKTTASMSIRCVHCSNETSRPGNTYVNDLIYPTKTKNQPRVAEPSFSQILKASVERENQMRGWCDKCRRYQQLVTRKSIESIPLVFMINTALSTPEAKQLWSKPGWLPDEIGIVIQSGQFFCFQGQDLKLHLQRGIHPITVYELIGVVADVNSGEHQKSHLVSIINVGISSREPEEENLWHLFNDFLVRPVTKDEALKFAQTWKLPSVLCYQIKSARNLIDDTWREKLDTSLVYSEYTVNQSEKIKDYRVLSQTTEAPQEGTLVAIDAEFVALQQEEIEIKADGTRETIRPSRLGLARVSVLRGSGPDEGLPFIDDYITASEAVVDYLTAYSGIQPGDLDPKQSRRTLVPLKVAYKKLWLLLNLGCIFVGHGLPKDFRTINIHVPKAQVVDTVDLFFIRARQRRLSLRFLAWFLLKESIQTENHDSIEDARTALKLYRKYLEFVDAGILPAMLTEIYTRGKDFNYKVPQPVQQVPTGSSNDAGTELGSGNNNTSTTTGAMMFGAGAPATPTLAPNNSNNNNGFAYPSTPSGTATPPLLRDNGPETPPVRTTPAPVVSSDGQFWTPTKGTYFGSPMR